MSPNRFEATMTSMLRGARTALAASASMSTFSSSTPPARSHDLATTSSQKGMVWMMPFDFVAEMSRPERPGATLDREARDALDAVRA